MWFEYECESIKDFYWYILNEIKATCGCRGNNCKGCMFYTDMGCFFIDCDMPENWKTYKLRDGKEQT